MPNDDGDYKHTREIHTFSDFKAIMLAKKEP